MVAFTAFPIERQEARLYCVILVVAHGFMTTAPPPLHVYARKTEAGERTSLAALAGHIPSGARVLDLGCGCGELGRLLAARDGAAAGPIDGLTINDDEARQAAALYRRVELADLDACRLTEKFEAANYDIIVCADVLEHLRQSGRVLAECKPLLAAGGRLLLSIPNVGYAGLVAELMAGEFRYRTEGLLDETHLRFFTRQTLLRFLQEGDWVVEQIEPVERQLPESEFRVAFDALPPAVARHLLALPDALAYQFITIGRPRRADETPAAPPPAEAPLPAQALFTVQLYLGQDGGFDEERKLTRAGVIGQARQTLRFALPADRPITGLKLDPADRPGYLYLHSLALRAGDGGALWQWTSADAVQLAGARMSGIVPEPPATPAGAFVLLLHGSDPWIELPVPAEALAQAGGGALDMELGWPMSADYLALAGAAEQRAQQAAAAQAAAHEALRQRDELRDDLTRQRDELRDDLTRQRDELIRERNQLRDELPRQRDELVRERDQLRDDLTRQYDELARERNLLRVDQTHQRDELIRERDQLRDDLTRQCDELIRERDQLRDDLTRQRNELRDDLTHQWDEQVRQRDQLVDDLTRQRDQLRDDLPRQYHELMRQRDELRDDLTRQLAQQSAQTDIERQARQRLEQQTEHLRAQKQTLLQHSRTFRRERDEIRQLVRDIENSTVFRATRPVVHAKMRIDRLLGVGSARPKAPAPKPLTLPQPLAPAQRPVDIIVPVYRGLQDTRRCLESVLASACKTPWRLIVIDDASPEPEVSAWLRAFASRDERIVLLENEHNLGFVGTVNRGMALADEHDVLLLNSDTEVAGDWLDRIRAAAYSDRQVASVTPFSNNATICSYPRFCQDNALPAGWNTARLDALFARVNAGQVVDVPTGVGFCMYIRRAALRELGLFDVAHFGKGYGEENDFCVRAANAGWRNLHALDTFVRHFGGVSFGDSKSPRERAAMETLRRLHPQYEADVMRFVRADPARPARAAVDLARALDGRRPLILAVLHDRAGGTERHVFEQAALLREQAQFLVLRPLPGQRLSLRLPSPDEAFELVFALPGQGEDLIGLLGRLGVRHVHFHHLLGHGEFVQQLPARLGVSHDFTWHDFYLMCPQKITLTDRSNGYCGELGVPQCADCLADSPAPDGVDIVRWRAHNAELLNAARFVIAPGRDALSRLLELVPGAPLRLVPHTDIDPAQPLPAPAPAPLAADRPLRVAVVGALSIIKGADVLEDLAVAAARQDAPLEFHLIGFAYRTLRAPPHAHLTVHGAYDEKDLPELLRSLQPDLIWFPAQWPETYSYTLSACLLGGWPVVAPNLGAFAERLSGRAWSWVRPWKQSTAQWLDFFLELRQCHFATGLGPPPVLALADNARLERTQGFESQPPAWYAGPYLADLSVPDAETVALPASAWAAYLPAADTDLAIVAKSRMLDVLIKLRALPVLAPIARAIPLRWQTRVKSWLRR